MYQRCMGLMNCSVRVHTCSGQCYEGVIVNVDRDNIYLRPSGGARISGKAQTSAWFGYGAAEGILTLSLFTLLAIALIW
ncbi:MAG: hypothetical protein H7X86_13170 [Gorillibacterium sp.]|nr:hypothetical protein [Gorillibacterium sp.]